MRDEGPKDRRRWVALAVLSLPTLLVSCDMFVMIMATPRMSAALHADATQQLWVLDVYGLMVAGFLLTMGDLGDRIGRRRLLLWGAVVFGVTSAVAAFSVDPTMLIVTRALLGVAGASLTPSTLSLIVSIFDDEHERGVAVGIWAACFTVGAIVGPIVGGLLVEHFWWGSVLLLGVPVMAVLVVLGPFLLPEHRPGGTRSTDLVGIVQSVAAVLLVVWAVTSLARYGWQAPSVVGLVLGAAIGAVFVRRQLRRDDPLLDVRLLRRRVSGVTIAALFVYTSLSAGTLVLVAQEFQLVVGLSPERAGLALAPAMVAAMIGFQVAPRLAGRVPPRVLVPGGLLVSAAGLAAAGAAAGRDLAVLMIGLALSCLGGTALVALGTALVVGSVHQSRAGMAAGVAQTANEFGGAFGVAVLGSMLGVVYRASVSRDSAISSLSAGSRDGATDDLAAAARVAHRLASTVGPRVLTSARGAYVQGLHVALWTGAAGMVALAALLAIVLPRPVEPSPAPRDLEPATTPTAADQQLARFDTTEEDPWPDTHS